MKKVSDKSLKDIKEDILKMFLVTYPTISGASLTQKQEQLITNISCYIENSFQSLRKELFFKG